MIQKLAVFVTKHPKLIILVSFLLLIPSAIGFFATGVNYDILSYLPEDLDSVTSLEILDKNFQFAASSIVILEDMPSKDVVKVKQEIEKLDCVVQVLWTDSVLDISVPVSILPDIAKDVFYSNNENSTMFIVQYSTGTSDDVTLEAVKTIRSILNEQCFISGISAAVADIKTLVEKEAIFYVAIAVIVALITLAFTMESLFMPLALFAALACAVVYNMGTNFFFGEISFISQCIAAVLQLGVTMDYSIFLIDRYEEELRITPDDRIAAMQRAIKTSFVSLSSSSLTTVFGFLAMCFMSLTIGLDLGIIMAKGVLMGIASVLIVLPAILLQFHSVLSKFKHKRLLPKFDRISKFTMKHKKVFSIVFAVLILPSFIAKDQMGIYYNIIKGLPSDTPSLIALDKMKEDFNMASTHFLLLPDTTPAKDVEKMMTEIEKLEGIEDVLALNTILGSAIDTSILPEIVKDLCYKDGYSLAMINSAYDAGSAEANAQVNEMRQIVTQYSDGGLATGEAVLMGDLAATADSDLILTSAISIIAILLLIMIAFKSVSIPVILVMSIELAIFINQAITWIMGTNVSFIAPIVLSCVQLGATVDYAILFTSRFKENLAAGMSRDEAAEKASSLSMRSIFQSALVFFTVTGSLALVSDITLITEMCVMLARGSLISAVVILFLLPPTMSLFEDIIKKTSKDWPLPAVIPAGIAVEKTARFNKHRLSRPAAAAPVKAKKHADEPTAEPKRPPERRYVQPIGTVNPPSKRMQMRSAAYGQTPAAPQQPPVYTPIQPPVQTPMGHGFPPAPPQAKPDRPPVTAQGIPARPQAAASEPFVPFTPPVQPPVVPPVYGQGVPPMPQQNIPAQPQMPQKGVPVRIAQPGMPQGFPAAPPAGFVPVQGVPVNVPPYPQQPQDAAVQFNRRSPMPQKATAAEPQPVSRPVQTPPPAASQNKSTEEINERRRSRFQALPPDPFEVNPYANKKPMQPKEDK